MASVSCVYRENIIYRERQPDKQREGVGGEGEGDDESILGQGCGHVKDVGSAAQVERFDIGEHRKFENIMNIAGPTRPLKNGTRSLSQPADPTR